MRATARVHGAITIVNAISIGKGAAMGIDLYTEATVEIGGRDIHVVIKENPDEDTTLAKAAVSKILKLAQMDCGAYVEISSNIPIGRGLKSSSAAANAVVLAATKAANLNLSDTDILNIGVDAAIEAGVTITGAYDDACASYYGGIVITDNLKRQIVRRVEAPEDYTVVLLVPELKSYTKFFDKSALRPIASLVEEAYKMSLNGEYWKALTLNGILHAAALNYSPKKALDAIRAGALAAGLSGTGPAIAAVCKKDAVSDVINALSEKECELIVAKPNNRKAYSWVGDHAASLG
ncbi:MAG: shikimate kinase [Nitrososphaerota archaeon]|nr:shikimate kinase [Aigarchaeota archaeon]MDW8076613.1 shikimate kinase [Nitrososphaerota archaeon]